MSLLLFALGKVMKKTSQEKEISQKKINNYYLFNNEEDGELKYKLLLTQSDKSTLISLLDDIELPNPISKNIKDNYHYFLEKLETTNIDLSLIYQGIAKLIIVDIALTQKHDNPQLIFESLNSTGLELSQADLIRNYILMDLEPKTQERIYNKYWYPMEQNFSHNTYVEQFDRFMRNYLTVKTGHIPNIREVYDEFKKYAQNKKTIDIEEIVSDIYRFSKHFVSMAFEREEDKEIVEIVKNINILKVDVAYPFFLEIYDDYKQSILSREDLIKILKLVESYVFRRLICGIPTNTLNKVFITLSKELDKKSYYESFQVALLRKDSYKRFPSDDEFKREFVIKDVYNLRNRNYLLHKLENINRKEKVYIEDYTIEHIMPQNDKLSTTWQKDLGNNWKEVHSKYLHTIGNLTLTGYNSELSDRPFKQKRDMLGGFADSPIRLNKSLAKLETWNESEINKRAEILADMAIKVWENPSILPEQLAKYRKKETINEKLYSLKDHEKFLKGNILELFEQLRKRILNLGSSVREEIKKRYIAYKSSTNFVDIVPLKKCLRLILNMAFTEIDDPKKICKDVTNVGRWGNGDIEITFDSLSQLEDIMYLINQSFEKHREDIE